MGNKRIYSNGYLIKNNKSSSDMEKQIYDLLTAVQNGEQSIGEAQEQLLLLFSVSSPDDFWKQEYDEAVKEIGNLQDQLKDAESAIRDMESELRSRY